MLRRAIRVLIALVVVVTGAMPSSVYAMPMAPAGMAADQPCQNCPQPDPTGNTTPDKMPLCQMLVCTGTLATLPAPVFEPVRVTFQIPYFATQPTRWAEASPAPDPFPPRPVGLL
jgi:hypothetical protein